MSTITAILEADEDGTIHLPLPPSLRQGKIRVVAILESESETSVPKVKTPLEALKQLRDAGGLHHVIPDPIAWQRDQRQESPLPGRI